MELSLPAVNTTEYRAIRQRYALGGGTYGINVRLFNGIPHLIAFVSDTDKYEDQSRNETLFYEFEDQEFCGVGKKRRLRKNPKALARFGPVGRNLTVIQALDWNGGTIPTIVIHKEGVNRWAELYTDCVCRGVSVASDGAHYFRIERSRVPQWLLGPVIDDSDDDDE